VAHRLAVCEELSGVLGKTNQSKIRVIARGANGIAPPRICLGEILDAAAAQHFVFGKLFA
jgi:hypothetical protein